MLEAPAALVDPVGQPERDEVRVGGDVGAVDLDVVAGVGDHDEVARRPRRACRGRAWRRRCRRPASRRGGRRSSASSSLWPRRGIRCPALMRARLLIATALVCLLVASLVPGCAGVQARARRGRAADRRERVAHPVRPAARVQAADDDAVLDRRAAAPGALAVLADRGGQGRCHRSPVRDRAGQGAPASAAGLPGLPAADSRSAPTSSRRRSGARAPTG